MSQLFCSNIPVRVPPKQDLITRISSFIHDESADSFDELALDVFRFQYASVPALAAFWAGLGATPDSVRHYTAIPPVGLAVFKRRELFAGERAARIFRTSGTSGMGMGASLFDVDDLALMDCSILTNAAHHLFKNGEKTRFFMLVPDPAEASGVIMAYGMRVIAARFGLGEPFYAVRGGELLLEESLDILRAWTIENSPVTLIGGSFGFVNFIDRLRDSCPGFRLPPGSRLLDAGGYKGRSRELDRDSFLATARDFFGLPEGQCFNLYGLTELASQFYCAGLAPKSPPHWTRVRVCEPLTLREVAQGERGVAVLYDLANCARPLAVLTDDIAVSHGAAGFDVVGRASGSPPRGCSLRLEELG
jgi:hypothetical protein